MDLNLLTVKNVKIEIVIKDEAGNETTISFKIFPNYPTLQ